jgi:nucleoside-diphosphate-sugar epimerase
MLKRIGAMIEIAPVIQDDPAMPVPVPLRYVSDTTRAIDELAWRPWIGIEDGLRELL